MLNFVLIGILICSFQVFALDFDDVLKAQDQLEIVVDDIDTVGEPGGFCAFAGYPNAIKVIHDEKVFDPQEIVRYIPGDSVFEGGGYGGLNDGSFVPQFRMIQFDGQRQVRIIKGITCSRVGTGLRLKTTTSSLFENLDELVITQFIHNNLPILVQLNDPTGLCMAFGYSATQQISTQKIQLKKNDRYISVPGTSPALYNGYTPSFIQSRVYNDGKYDKITNLKCIRPTKNAPVVRSLRLDQALAELESVTITVKEPDAPLLLGNPTGVCLALGYDFNPEANFISNQVVKAGQPFIDFNVPGLVTKPDTPLMRLRTSSTDAVRNILENVTCMRTRGKRPPADPSFQKNFQNMDSKSFLNLNYKGEIITGSPESFCKFMGYSAVGNFSGEKLKLPKDMVYFGFRESGKTLQRKRHAIFFRKNNAYEEEKVLSLKSVTCLKVPGSNP